MNTMMAILLVLSPLAGFLAIDAILIELDLKRTDKRIRALELRILEQTNQALALEGWFEEQEKKAAI